MTDHHRETPTGDARATTTTIGKYIARFRRESPRPRDARATTPREDFWWLEARRETAAGSPRNRSRTDANQADSEDARERRSAMEWELELLSGTSDEAVSLSSVDGRRVRGTSDDDLAHARSSSFSSASMASPSSSWHVEPRGSLDASESVSRNSRQQASHHEDDGFVVLSADALEEKAMLEASLEDPEMVIQRIRRRLGYQQPTTVASASSYFPVDPLLLSPPHEASKLDAKPFDATFISETSYNITSPGAGFGHTQETQEKDPRASLRLDLSMSLDEVVTGGDSPLVRDFSQLALDAPAGPVDNGFYRGDASSFLGVQPPDNSLTAADKCELDDNESIGMDTCNESVAGTPTHQGGNAQQDPLSQGESTSHPAAEVEAVLDKHDVGISESEKLVDAASESRDSSHLTDQDREVVSSDDDKKVPAVEGELREKRSPRLPPLSPARGPIYRSLPVTPRALDSSEPEFTEETSKTLDSLLSFVVQSWGENSLFGGSEDGDHKSQGGAASMPDKSTTKQSEESLDIPPAFEESYAHEEKAVETQPLVEEPDSIANAEIDQHDVEAFADDPVVAMLRERITVFEEALQQLTNTDTSR